MPSSQPSRVRPPTLSRVVSGLRLAVALALAPVALAGCDRGWLMSWLTSHGLVGEDPTHTAPGSLRLHEVDCPAGLARCVEGAVEVAQVFRHPEPCKGGTEICECPWQVVGRCAASCVADGVSMPLSPERATKQLCAPGPTDPPVARPPPLGTPPAVACGDEGYRCVGANVVACPDGRVVAACATRCAQEGETLDDPSAEDAAAVFLLCAR